LTPTARTLATLRRDGFLAVPVERWLPAVGRKVDLLGVADVLAVHARDRLFLLVQATSAAHVADRLKRCRQRPELAVWLAAGGAFEVWGWAKRGERWHVRKVAITGADLAEVPLAGIPRRRRRGRGERQGELFAD
jgi:hypothetical protein